MILGVFGPRDFIVVNYSNYEYIASCLEDYDITKLVSGGGQGVEQLALRYASINGIQTKVVYPDQQQHGRTGREAFHLRNIEIIGKIEAGVLFWDGKDQFYQKLISEFIFHKKILTVRHME